MKEMKEILANIPKTKAATSSIPSSKIGNGSNASKATIPGRPGTALGTSTKAPAASFGLKRPSTAVTSAIKKK